MRTRNRSLARQRGYLYLSTGANGAGKTLFTLEDVRKLQLETNRPVFFKGFVAKQPLLDFGWVAHDMRDWQSLPDGSICVWDECQEEIVSQTAKDALEYESKILSEHRKRGFDFFFITQHPMNMGAFIRRTVATPGWHRHFKASSIALNSNELKWTAVNSQPERPNSGATGTVTSRTHPKEVYDWYTSTVGDTAKRKIPARVWFAILAVLVAIGMIAGAVMWAKHLYAGWTKPEPEKAVKAPTKTAAGVPPAGGGHGGGGDDRKRALSPAEYAESFQPRIAGLAYTATRYDGLTQPRQVPKPAACIDGTPRGTAVRTCKCYTQQATLLDVPADICRQIATGGFFDDSLEPPSQAQQTKAPSVPSVPVLAPPTVLAAYEEPKDRHPTVGTLLAPMETRSTVERDGEILKQMRKREYIK